MKKKGKAIKCKGYFMKGSTYIQFSLSEKGK